MIKNIVTYSTSFVLLASISFFAHNYFTKILSLDLRFDIFPVYVFHFSISLSICIIFEILSRVSRFQTQLGFIYMGTLFFKVMVFSAAFYKSILSIQLITRVESLNLLIPVFIFLIAEVYFIARILNRK